MSYSWADNFIKICLEQGVDTEIGIKQAAEENTELYESEVVELLRSEETEFSKEIQFSTCTCGSELMYDSTEQEYYCPVCD